VLDWLGVPSFPTELLKLVEPTGAKITSNSRWAPMGYKFPDEARLESWGPTAFAHPAWEALHCWWLAAPRAANTPNWDLAACVEIEGRSGLILVEAKANVAEMSTAGKDAPGASEASRANHEQIGRAIEEARCALMAIAPDIAIRRESHYQLSNRLAFAWKLASLGIPVVLVYLCFLGDTGICDVSPPFKDAEHWERMFRAYIKGVGAEALLVERRHETKGTPFWFWARSREVLERSPCV
jgi:hypothetical protein